MIKNVKNINFIFNLKLTIFCHKNSSINQLFSLFIKANLSHIKHLHC
jgi:hypothetical protein